MLKPALSKASVRAGQTGGIERHSRGAIEVRTQGSVGRPPCPHCVTNGLHHTGQRASHRRLPNTDAHHATGSGNTLKMVVRQVARAWTVPSTPVCDTSTRRHGQHIVNQGPGSVGKVDQHVPTSRCTTAAKGVKPPFPDHGLFVVKKWVNPAIGTHRTDAFSKSSVTRIAAVLKH